MVLSGIFCILYNRMKGGFFICLCVVLLTVSCGGRSSFLKDGYYTAEAVGYSPNGWKDYVTISVSGRQIIHIEYNAYNSSGFLRSWDMDYMRRMKAATGTYPSAYSRYYGGLFLENQGTDGIDALSGATYSHKIFLRLVEAVLKNAREGNRKTALVDFERPI